MQLKGYFWLAAPGFLKLLGGVVILFSLPYQHILLPETNSLSGEINSLTERSLQEISGLNETLVRSLENQHRIDELSSREYITTEQKEELGKVSDENRELIGKSEISIREFEKDIVELSQISDRIIAQRGKIRDEMFKAALFGGILILVGMFWENHLKVIKELRREE